MKSKFCFLATATAYRIYDSVCFSIKRWLLVRLQCTLCFFFFFFFFFLFFFCGRWSDEVTSAVVSGEGKGETYVCIIHWCGVRETWACRKTRRRICKFVDDVLCVPWTDQWKYTPSLKYNRSGGTPLLCCVCVPNTGRHSYYLYLKTLALYPRIRLYRTDHTRYSCAISSPDDRAFTSQQHAQDCKPARTHMSVRGSVTFIMRLTFKWIVKQSNRDGFNDSGF